MVETTFAHLSESFGLKYPGAHSTWGLLMRVAAKVAAYNLGIMINREQDVRFEAVHVGRVLGGMEDAGNDVNIVVLDACRDNPFARSFRSGGQRGLAAPPAVRGSLIAYATAPGKTAADGTGRNGIYTQHLLQHITTPGLKVEDVFKKVRQAVEDSTQRQQTPWETTSLRGDFYFAATGSGSLPATASTPGPASRATIPAVVQRRSATWVCPGGLDHPADGEAPDGLANSRWAATARTASGSRDLPSGVNVRAYAAIRRVAQ